MPSFKKAKSNNWIENDQFGDFNACKDATTTTKSPRKTPGGRKRNRENNNTIKQGPSKAFSMPETDLDQDRMAAPASSVLDPSQLWIQRHHPASVEELAVNTKKIDEVRSWLVSSVNKGNVRHSNVQSSVTHDFCLQEDCWCLQGLQGRERRPC